MTSLRTSYSVDDPRSYKTICLRCNYVRSLTNPDLVLHVDIVFSFVACFGKS
jgi:hypothetical protein